jgi:hypothetical protein
LRSLVVCLRLAVLAAVFTASGWCQFSPGPLSRAHHSLDGPTRCTSCHITGGGQKRLRCLSCHTEIRRRLAEHSGLHPSLVGAGRADDQCARCHSEHNGENFIPTRWDVSLDEFDHRKTGYPLEGGHARLKCSACHAPNKISIAMRKEIRMKDLTRTYLGLSRECASCHQDEHRGQLGASCDRCHSTSQWREVSKFDHSSSRFRLTGAHTKTPCVKCHPAVSFAGAAKPVVRYTGIPFAQCSACHRDVHNGAFTADCSQCHTDLAWKPARNTAVSFDHSRTKFPLLGKHEAVACNQCHKTADFKAPVAHDRCAACHRDVHAGQFATRNDHGECGSCHTADGWRPSTYTMQSHAASAYPLLGKHAAVRCDACHKPAGAATLYRIAFRNCTDCHHDPHAGQFTAAAKEERCESCHSVDRFRPAEFPLARHQKTRFVLRGAHLAVACDDCHKAPAGRNTAYHFSSLSCESCHTDPHQGQFAARMAPGGGCEACHDQNRWENIAKFNHATTRFALTGAHRGVACERCHRATALSTGLRRVVYRQAPLTCDDCHDDIHGGQFLTAAGRQDCASCHGTGRWNDAAFDHSRTSFPLVGAHRQVPCRDCHLTRRVVNGRSVLYYKPTPKECSSCHGPKTN